MTPERIKQAVDALRTHYAANPQRAVAADKTATATIESGLRAVATGPKGESLVTDMPGGIGGDNSAPTPGWYLRAALANCDATMIAMRAAELGIHLTRLEVTVGSESDNRGLISDDEGIPPGPLRFDIAVRIAADGVADDVLHDLVRWAERHSPVGDALRRSVAVHATVMPPEPGAAR